MARRMPVKRLPYLAGQPHHVLIVLEDGNPLLVLVGSDTLETLQHLVALDGEPARAAWRSESSVLHIECVCSTAPAPRARTIST